MRCPSYCRWPAKDWKSLNGEALAFLHTSVHVVLPPRRSDPAQPIRTDAETEATRTIYASARGPTLGGSRGLREYWLACFVMSTHISGEAAESVGRGRRATRWQVKRTIACNMLHIAIDPAGCKFLQTAEVASRLCQSARCQQSTAPLP